MPDLTPADVELLAQVDAIRKLRVESWELDNRDHIARRVERAALRTGSDERELRRGADAAPPVVRPSAEPDDSMTDAERAIAPFRAWAENFRANAPMLGEALRQRLGGEIRAALPDVREPAAARPAGDAGDTAPPPAGLPATIDGYDDVAAVCVAAGLTRFSDEDEWADSHVTVWARPPQIPGDPFSEVAVDVARSGYYARLGTVRPWMPSSALWHLIDAARTAGEAR